MAAALAYEIAHSLPGRIRFKTTDRVRNYQESAQLTEWMRALPLAIDVRHNPRCGSLIISYDSEKPEHLELICERVRSFDPANFEQAWLELPDRTSQPTLLDRAVAALNELVRLLQRAEPNEGARLALASGALALSFAPPPLKLAGTALAAYSSTPSFHRALATLLGEHRMNVDLLDSLAITVSAAQGKAFTTAFMAWLIALGDWIRARTAARSRRSLSDMLGYQQRRAWLLRGDDKISVAVSSIEEGDTVVVYAGEIVPVDGTLVSGVATVDQSTITGEAMPVLKSGNDKVYAASVVHEGKLYLRAAHRAEDSLAAQIVRMVESTPIGETRMQNYAEKFADRLVAPTLALAGFSYLLTRNLDLMLSILIVDLGTGIRVAAPTTVLASISSAVGRGVVIRGGNRMERLAHLDAMVFDKTGTLTRGAPEIIEVLSYKRDSFSPNQVLQAAAAAEQRFNHPVALATLARAHAAGIAVPLRSDSKYQIGMGVEARVNGYIVHVGSPRFFRERKIKFDSALEDCRRANRSGQSTLMVAIDGETVGQLVYEEKIRPETAGVIRELKRRAIDELVMLTGDSQAAAQHVAAALGITNFYAEIMPNEKAEVVQDLRRQGKVVAMVGDGINDAAALSYADVGIAMKNGTDLAQESAHVVLMQDDLSRVVTAIDIARNALRLVNQNYAIVAGINVAALAMALTSRRVPPEITALLSNGSAVLASANGLRPLLY